MCTVHIVKYTYTYESVWYSKLFVAPSAPQSLEKDTVTSTSVTLKWKPPEYSNGVITKYSIHYGGVDIDQFGGDVSDTMSDTIKGLSPDTVYLLKMKAYTRVGPGPPVNLAIKTCKLLMYINHYSMGFHVAIKYMYSSML